MLFNDPARASVLLLTSLMVIGLGFFIRASTKDRIEVAQFGSVQSAENLNQAVVKYFYSRAYQPQVEIQTEIQAEIQADDQAADNPKPESRKAQRKAKNEAVIIDGSTMVGVVSPSVFLAVFLSVLAAVGFACLSLIVATLFPAWGGWLLGWVAASPLAGVFYWKKSSRPETIVFRVDAVTQEDAIAPADAISSEEAQPESAKEWRSQLTVQGHRDELANLEDAFAQPELQSWAGLAKIRQG